MKKLPYNPNSKESVIAYAKKLINKSLREACGANLNEGAFSGKGFFGQILEKYYFFYNPNSNPEADFSSVGLELKSSPLKQLMSKEYRSKERLVLNIIDYLEIVNQSFETSSFWNKNANLILVFYLYKSNVDILDYVIKLVDEWSFPKTDLEIIKKDWEIIKSKVQAGKAHELSEGDTYYLGACTKGSSSETVRNQPFSSIKAKQRAYSLKQGYVNHIIASISKNEKDIYGKLIPNLEVAKKKSLEDIVVSKFMRYYGKTSEEITSNLDIKLNKSAKSYFANLTKAILGIELNKDIEEFSKADIILKTIRLKENNLPKEDISFPTFRYETLINENWDESDFKNILEHKFLFVFFQFENNKLVLKKAKFWNMPHNDIIQAEKVWNKTKELIQTGNIVKEVRGSYRKTFFPKKSFNYVAHVRPHARNANDTYPLPVIDKLTNATEYTKHCFWLNSQYVRDYIFLE